MITGVINDFLFFYFFHKTTMALNNTPTPKFFTASDFLNYWFPSGKILGMFPHVAFTLENLSTGYRLRSDNLTVSLTLAKQVHKRYSIKNPNSTLLKRAAGQPFTGIALTIEKEPSFHFQKFFFFRDSFKSITAKLERKGRKKASFPVLHYKIDPHDFSWLKYQPDPFLLEVLFVKLRLAIKKALPKPLVSLKEKLTKIINKKCKVHS